MVTMHWWCKYFYTISTYQLISIKKLFNFKINKNMSHYTTVTMLTEINFTMMDNKTKVKLRYKIYIFCISDLFSSIATGNKNKILPAGAALTIWPTYIVKILIVTYKLSYYRFSHPIGLSFYLNKTFQNFEVQSQRSNVVWLVALI